MYVCHCNRLPERDIRAAIARLVAEGAQPDAADVLAALYRAGVCQGCFPLIETLVGDIAMAASSATPPEMANPRESGAQRTDIPVIGAIVADDRAATNSELTVSPQPGERSAPRRRRGGAFARRPAANSGS